MKAAFWLLRLHLCRVWSKTLNQGSKFHEVHLPRVLFTSRWPIVPSLFQRALEGLTNLSFAK